MKFNPNEYFTIEVGKLKSGRALLFDLFIHLPLNDRIIRVCQAGDELEPRVFEQFKLFKVFHVLASERELFEAYMVEETRGETERLASPPPPPPAEPVAPVIPIVQAASEQAAPAPTEKTKEFVPEKEPEEIIAGLMKEGPEKSAAMDEGKAMVKKILEGAPPEMAAIIENPATEHATTVAVYTALFAMGLGKRDQFVLQDLIIASLMHDIGICQILPEVLAVPMTKRTPEQTAIYEEHSPRGVALLMELGYQPNTRALTILNQHHERFDGKGYPNHIASFKVDELAQMLCFADLLDDLGRGQYDGVSRTLPEAIGMVAQIEKQTSFPQYFNPDVLKKIRTWLTKGGGQDHMAAATNAVKETQDRLMKAG